MLTITSESCCRDQACGGPLPQGSVRMRYFTRQSSTGTGDGKAVLLRLAPGSSSGVFEAESESRKDDVEC